MARKNRLDTEQVRIQNAAKSLVANIRFASIDNPVRSIAVTSAVPNEGKTTVAVALAQAIASLGERVLLVECDMRRRSLATKLGVHSRGGLYSVVCGQTDLDEAVVTTSTRGLYFLDVEPHIPNPEAVLNSKRFKLFHDRAVSTYRYVIYDTPPLSAFVDAAVLSTVVDGTLLVVGENVVRRDELVTAYSQLQKADANVLGAVTNMSSSSDDSYYDRYFESGGSDAARMEGLAAEPLAQRDDTLRSAAAHQRGVSPQRAVAANQAYTQVHGASATGSVSPESTAQFMVGRYGSESAQ